MPVQTFACFGKEDIYSLFSNNVSDENDDSTLPWSAIYHGDDMVGFIMHAFEEETRDMYWINGFLIDAGCQGKGYGKAALLQMIDYITNRFSQCQEVRLTVHPHNKAALQLYRRLGFAETGEVYDGELVMRLPIGASSQHDR